MAESFDPYRRWLGIPSGERPPNHYLLLGLSLFEEDADAISNAADRQIKLELFVDCPGNYGWGHAAWVEPWLEQ